MAAGCRTFFWLVGGKLTGYFSDFHHQSSGFNQKVQPEIDPVSLALTGEFLSSVSSGKFWTIVSWLTFLCFYISSNVGMYISSTSTNSIYLNLLFGTRAMPGRLTAFSYKQGTGDTEGAQRVLLNFSPAPFLWYFSILKEHKGNKILDREVNPKRNTGFCFFNFSLAALGLHCNAQAFSCCSEQGGLSLVVHWLCMAVASLVAEDRLQGTRSP